MAKRKQSSRRKGRPRAASSGRAIKPTQRDTAADEQFAYSGNSLHQLFEQQTRQMLDRTDLDEEHKQGILAAMSCPCCGAGAMSYTVKLKR